MNLEELKKTVFGESSKKSGSDISLTTHTIYDEWSSLKSVLNEKSDFPRPKRRQIWWCAVGLNVGQEQSNLEGYERPVLVVAVFGSIFWGIPITSSDPHGKKKKNPLFYDLEGTIYTDDKGNGKVLHGYAALHQLRAYDSRRLLRKILKIDPVIFDEIVVKIKGLI